MELILPLIRLFQAALIVCCVVIPCYAAEDTPRVDFVVSNELSRDYPALLRAAQAYYVAEGEHSWKETYSYRSSRFQQVVPFETYSGLMDQSTSGWELHKVTILEMRTAGNRALLEVEFVESYDAAVASQRFGGRVPPGELTSEGTAVWELVEGDWICLDAVSRGHIGLNSRIAQ